MKNIEITYSQAPVRLDHFLKKQYPALSIAVLRQLLDQGKIQVNRRPAKKGLLLRPGDSLEIDADLDKQLKLGLPQPHPSLPCRLLVKEAGYLVLDKPAGMHSAVQKPEEVDTVANWLAAHHPECLTASPDPRDAGLLHRLDRGTSGLLVAARTPAEYRRLRRLWQEQGVGKKYLALVHGQVLKNEGEVALPLAHHHSDPRRMVVIETEITPHRGKILPARTGFRRLKVFNGASLLEVSLITGVMHQIRIHLNALGHPLVGENLYASPPPLLPPFTMARYFLHAAHLTLAPHLGGAPVSYESPLPKELSDYLSALT